MAVLTRWIWVLASLMGSLSVLGALAFENGRSSPPFQTFAAPCGPHQEQISPDAAHTVQQLLSVAGTSDCTEAEALLNQETALVLERLQLKDISPLATLDQLQWLSLSVNQIEDVSPLRSLANLEHLFLDTNQIFNLRPLLRLSNTIK
ncbi:MAG: leucine-rich repeat domain-containing protein [Thainema sp.]